jgi:nucleoside-diphosphate-sugar epimerase
MNHETNTPRFVVIGAGQVGAVLCARLRERVADAEIIVVSRHKTHIAGATHIAKDLLKDDLFDVVTADVDAVFLAVNAPYTARQWAESLPVMQRTVVTACTRVQATLVVLENLYVYGPSVTPLNEGMTMNATTNKGMIRQRLHEELVAHRNNIRVVSIRPSDFWGPGLSSAHLNDKAIRDILAGKTLQAVGDVNVPHARSHVRDVADAMITLATCTDDDVFGRVWHPPVIHASTTQMVDAIAAAARVKSPGARGLSRWSIGMLGMFVPVLRELYELSYQWTQPYLVDDSAFRQRFAASAVSLEAGAIECVRHARAS